FYTMFNLAPVGQFHVQLCGTTPCVLRGADKLIKLCHDTIGEPLNVSADGKLSWVEVECLGACVNAPVAQINYDYYEDLTPESFTKIWAALVAGKAVKPGPQVARQFSAPSGGPPTLTDPALYARKNGGQPHSPPLGDADAKAGAPANVRQAAVPKSPIGDSSRNRRAWCSRIRTASSRISMASTTGASRAPARPAPWTAPRPPWGRAAIGPSTR